MTELGAAPPDPLPPRPTRRSGASIGSTWPRLLRARMQGGCESSRPEANRRRAGPFMRRPSEPNSNLEPLKGMERAPARSGPAGPRLPGRLRIPNPAAAAGKGNFPNLPRSRHDLGQRARASWQGFTRTGLENAAGSGHGDAAPNLPGSCLRLLPRSFFLLRSCRQGGIAFADLTERSEGWSVWVTCLERLKRESSWHCVFELLLTMSKKRREKKKTQISRVPLQLFLIFQWKKPGLLSFCKLFLQRVQVSVNSCLKLKGKKTKSPLLLPEQ